MLSLKTRSVLLTTVQYVLILRGSLVNQGEVCGYLGKPTYSTHLYINHQPQMRMCTKHWEGTLWTVEVLGTLETLGTVGTSATLGTLEMLGTLGTL